MCQFNDAPLSDAPFNEAPFNEAPLREAPLDDTFLTALRLSDAPAFVTTVDAGTALHMTTAIPVPATTAANPRIFGISNPISSSRLCRPTPLVGRSH